MALLTAYLIGGQPVGTVVESWTDTDLGGNPPFLVEDTVSAGYQDISSTENWTRFGLSSGVDYKRVCDEIADIVTTTTYALLSDEDKRAALRCFQGGSGNDYTDVLYSESQYDGYHATHVERLDEAMLARDEAVQRLLNKKIMTGVIAQADVAALLDAVRALRQDFRDDHVIGSQHGNIAMGIADFLSNTGSRYQGELITAIDTVANKATVGGGWSDLKNFIGGETIRIEGSTGNDGLYENDGVPTKVSSTVELMLVEGDLTDATADGTLYWNGFKVYAAYSTAFRDELLAIYVDGIY